MGIVKTLLRLIGYVVLALCTAGGVMLVASAQSAPEPPSLVCAPNDLVMSISDSLAQDPSGGDSDAALAAENFVTESYPQAPSATPEEITASTGTAEFSLETSGQTWGIVRANEQNGQWYVTGFVACDDQLGGADPIGESS